MDVRHMLTVFERTCRKEHDGRIASSLSMRLLPTPEADTLVGPTPEADTLVGPTLTRGESQKSQTRYGYDDTGGADNNDTDAAIQTFIVKDAHHEYKYPALAINYAGPHTKKVPIGNSRS